MDRIFLDANILFSAAYRADSGLVRLWNLKDVELITSTYALHEALSNLETELQCERLMALMEKVKLLERVTVLPLPEEIRLPEKDQPIFQAAITGCATYLLTGDIRHFGELFGKTVQGVTVMRPAEYLKSRK